MRSQDHLSVSAISSYVDCSLAFKFGRIDRLRPEHEPDAMVFGKAIHAVLAEFYESLLEGNKMRVSDLHEFFTVHWIDAAHGRDEIVYKTGKDYDTMLLEGKELLTAFYHNLPEDRSAIIGVEQPFSYTVENLPIPLIGVYDLVLEDEAGVITIVDHKTTARAYSADEVDKNFQMLVYQMAAKANGFKDREVLLRLDCLVKTKKPKFEQYYTTRSNADEQRALRKIQAVWDGIQKGVFIPNDESWKCSGCVYQNACNEWFEGRIA
jgi:putative RecB family exonuclease